ncbi:hypothetical protein G7077_08125 [Sphingomonas piscis]|uniref:DUF5681 domain-containing protein n=1 Tax=Sphingomonas piscis TaxID=2714943 RepID=A0A6G7YQ45_9SPHN|nr:DUF5681 domain-containing protein [Sphingomonas piscis]QIK78865.1 hypothetical protein G7077_08125 [Sphingomonas piscis]
MSEDINDREDEVGYGRPPRSTRFQKVRSGNPKGRPRNSRREIPYDHVLGQMVTIREDGRERRVTAAEAFMLQLTRKGLQGDSASARASLAAIELARSKREPAGPEITAIICKGVTPGGVGCTLDNLGMAVKRDKYGDNTRHELKPWLIELALERLGSRRLSIEEQRIVVDATHKPGTVRWPEWWAISR